jgi:predicted transcriptional regulator
LLIKVPTYWIDAVLRKRVTVNDYQTNRYIKHIGVFCLLKTVSSTGILHNWSSQSNLRELCKLSRNSFKSSVNQLNELGLIKIVGKDLKLSGWKEASQIIIQDDHDNEFTHFEYDLINDAKIHHYFYALNIKLNQDTQRKSFENRLKFNPHIKRDLIDSICMTFNLNESQVTKMTIDEFMECAYQLQNKLFCGGTLRVEIFKLNPDTNRNLSAIKNDWNFKSTKSISYYKRRLMSFGLTQTEKIGQLLSSTKNRIRQVDGYSSGWNRVHKLPTWNRVDRVHVLINVG